MVEESSEGGRTMLAWMKARQPDPVVPDPPPQSPPPQKKVDCKERLAEVECELKITRLRRKDQERTEGKRQKQKARAKRESAALAKQGEKVKRRQDRRNARHAWWNRFREERRKRREEAGGVSGTFRVFLFLGLPAIAALVIYALALSGDKGEVLAIGLLTAVSAFAVGALIGFLFGIPRSLAGTGATGNPATSGSTDRASSAAGQHFETNTNLEQISDWLTKILIGVGLVQIHQISGAVEDLAAGLAPGLGPQGPSVAVALLVSFSVIGFISGYLYTRLRLQGDFENASKLKAIEKQSKTENSAIALVQNQLTPGVEKPPLAELTEKLKEATPEVREQAFFLARRQRLEKWADEGSDLEREELPGLSAPIFQALIACDTEGEYYRPSAELGFVLLEVKPHDFPRAKLAFDTAIERRPEELIERTPEYELNRSYCNIELDGEYRRKRLSSKPLMESVAADLEAVIAYLGEVKEEKYRVVRKWLEDNAKSEEYAPRLEPLLDRFKGLETFGGRPTSR